MYFLWVWRNKLRRIFEKIINLYSYRMILPYLIYTFFYYGFIIELRK